MMKTICVVLMSLMFCLSANAETYFFVSFSNPLLAEERENGDFQGAAVDIARIITEKLGHTIKFGLYPLARAQKMVRDGDADVLMSPYKTPEREEWFDFTDIPFYTDKTVFFIRPDSTLTWNGEYASLKGKTIGMSLGWSFGAEFERARASLSLDDAPSLDLCFKKLLAKRVDLVPTQPVEAEASFRRLGLTNDQKPVAILPPLTIGPHYFAFSKQKQKELAAFKKDFDQMLKQMQENGELSQVLAKYGLSDVR